MTYVKTPRQTRLEELAQKAWSDQSVEVVSPEEGTLHVWGDGGLVLLHAQHPLADEVLAVLARELGAMSINAAIDAVEMMLRERMFGHGFDVIGIREGKVVAFDSEGRQSASGGSLREMIANMDSRASSRRNRNHSELPSAVRTVVLPADGGGK